MLPKRVGDIRGLIDEIDAVECELRPNGVLTVTLRFDDVYERGTHTTAECFAELGTLFDCVSMNDEVRVVVLRGPGGGRRFTTYPASMVAQRGYRSEEQADPALIAARSGSNRFLSRYYAMYFQMDQPVICSMNGDAIMATTTLVQVCDIILATADARFGDPHTVMGAAAIGGPVLWPMATSIHAAAEYLYTGDLMTADRARELGLVNHVYPSPERTDEEAQALADRLAALPTHGLTYTKRTIRKQMARKHYELYDEGVAMQQLRNFVAVEDIASRGADTLLQEGGIPGWEYDKNRNEVAAEQLTVADDGVRA